MTTSVLDVWNGALSKAHARAKVSSLTESSRERELCSRWYDITRHLVLEAAHWPGTRSVARLALLAERNTALDWVAGDPPPQYIYSYALPEDYIRAWYMSDYTPFEVYYDHTRSRRVIVTNTEDAVLVYARDNENVVDWTPGQKMATMLGLAANLVGDLAGSRTLKQDLFREANDHLLEAQSNALNSESFQVDTLPPWLAVRGYAEGPTLTRFYYPFGGLFAGALNNA